MAKKISVGISLDKSYTAIIAGHIWSDFFNHCQANYSTGKIFIVIDENVNRLHGDEIKERCSVYFKDCHIIEVPAGEKSKSLKVWKRLLNELLENGIERSTPLLAAGGGVTGDLAGFVASSALRGVPLIHLPTTLLAMVDSSIGGKTGVNHTAGKNLIGAFYQPDAVFAHLPFLKTLSEREWVNGLSEMLKYAAISKPKLFDRLEATAGNFNPNEKWEQLIYECVQIKSAVVAADAHEAGQRAFLNFGHTFGHALEKFAGYGKITHGEAVFVGMIAATRLSEQSGAPVEAARFHPFKTLYNISLPATDEIEALIDMMYSDKKVKNERLRLILLKGWGEPFVKEVEDRNLLKDAWQAALQVGLPTRR